MSKLSYSVIIAGPEWLDRWIAFCQRVYSVYYVRPEHGITADMFSEDVFANSGFGGYVKNYFNNDKDRRVWLAIVDEHNIIGSLVAHIHDDFCELSGFYVTPDQKGYGIGRDLYDRALAYAGTLPLQLDVVNDMTATIAMYEHWGFRIDQHKGYIEYPWKGWTDEALYANRGIYMIKTGCAIQDNNPKQ